MEANPENDRGGGGQRRGGRKRERSGDERKRGKVAWVNGKGVYEERESRYAQGKDRAQPRGI